MSKIEISKSVCSLLGNISKYNYNYYCIPVLVDDCDVVLEICDESYSSYKYVLGTLLEGAFSDDGNHVSYGCKYGFEKCYMDIILDGKYKNIKLG